MPFCGLIAYVKQLLRKGEGGGLLAPGSAAGIGLCCCRNDEGSGGEQESGGDRGMGDEDWQLSKDSADAATAGVCRGMPIGEPTERKQKAESNTATEVLLPLKKAYVFLLETHGRPSSAGGRRSVALCS